MYEEWNEDEDGEIISDDEDTVGSSSSSKTKMKTRYLAQVVSPSQPTYMHAMVLNENESALDESSSSAWSSDDASASGIGRSHVGVIETQAGYTLVEISAEERTAVVSERLTAEAVSCRLVAYPPADPLFYVPPSDEADNRKTDRLPFLPWRQLQRNQQSQVILSPVSKCRVKVVPPSLVVEPAPGLTDLERAKQTIVSAFLRTEDFGTLDNDNENASAPPKRRERTRVSHRDFVLITPNSGGTSPLHLETAKQLGLMGDTSIPSLVASLLPYNTPISCKRFFRRWLLVRPPPEVADAMSSLIQALIEGNRALPISQVLTAKIIPMIRAGEASAAIYRDIISALDAAIQLLEQDNGDGNTDITSPLIKVLEYDTGIEVESSSSLKQSIIDAKQMIEEVVQTYDGASSIDEREQISSFGDVIPAAFFERNEIGWRGRVKRSALNNVPAKVAHTSMQLAEAVAADYWGIDTIQYNANGELDMTTSKSTKNPTVQDVLNNIIAIKEFPAWAKETKTRDKSYYYHPRDRNGKLLTTRYTTERVENALSDYIQSCDDAKTAVARALRMLSSKLVESDHISTIHQASHLNLILSTAVNHAASSKRKGWSTGEVFEQTSDGSAGFFNGLWPYWMDKSSSVSNTFDLNGMFLLTAPNMSG